MKDNYLLGAKRSGIAIGAYNVNTYDEMLAIADLAAACNQQVILMASMSCVRFIGAGHFASLVRLLNAERPVSIKSHLDHCTDPNMVIQCAKSGFDMVMYDGSPLPFEENAAITKDLVQKCHAMGVLVEGELGVLAGNEGPVKSDVSKFTDPAEAKKFVEQTGIDALAVSIGNAHGFYDGEPKLRFDLLEKIAQNCPVPLVLHGGTGIPAQDIKKAIGMGICKVNVGTEIRNSYVQALYAYTQEDPKGDVREFVKFLRLKVAESAKRYMDHFSCPNS